MRVIAVMVIHRERKAESTAGIWRSILRKSLHAPTMAITLFAWSIPPGNISTVAGSSAGPGYSGDIGPATSAQLNQPRAGAG